ncbi:MAG: 30S ribosomal protein S13 [candidate division WOR-3 bacterium]|nr:30S ribosomal protein S13 [candidate division WOR-3 bacterium]MCX7757773.1 30S ribosomal protein S13 [candidate division WOR-3 bacterium]MDW7988073.1 30S ribosomal protein S13 [candidate division WOR-3 bacterium]
MARLLGVDLEDNKQILYALPKIYGIGPSNAKKILDTVGVPYNKKVKDLTDEEFTKIRKEIEANYKIEGVLRAEVQANIKRYIDIGCYRGERHRRGLPVRGQRTRTNARTRKGPRKTSGVIKVKAQAKPK